MTIYGKKPRKIRCLIVLTILILLISLVMSGFSAEANDTNITNKNSDEQLISIYVKDGDTLWGLVDRYCDTKEDIREIIYEVEKLNNITNANIYEGQTLYLPIN